MRLTEYFDPENVAGFTKQTLGMLADVGGAIAEDPQGIATEVWDGMHPMDKAALVTAPVPIVGDITGLAADARMYYEEPESRTPANFMMTAAGALPFVPPAVGQKTVGDAMGILSDKASERFQPRATLDPTREETMISSRYPQGAGRLTDPDSEILTSGMNDMTPESLDKHLGKIMEYPAFKGKLRSSTDPESLFSEFKDVATGNLLRAWDEMPEEIRPAAMEWYEGANKIRGGIAQEYGLPREVVSGVIAATSPQNPWDNNLSAAERIIDTWKRHQTTTYSPEMEQAYLKRVKEKKGGETPWDQAGRKKGESIDSTIIERIRGKRLEELDHKVDKAAWIRLFDESNNPTDMDVWAPTGQRTGTAMTGKGVPQKFSWGSFGQMGNAVDMLDDQSLGNISRNLGDQHKVRNFYNNIENPMSDKFYTSDTHNVSAALFSPLGSSSPEVAHSFGGAGSSAITGHQGSYPLYQDVGEDVAKMKGVLPRQVQSVTWESIRNIFDNKSAPVKAEAQRIWGEYASNKLTLEQAQDRLLELSGGFTNPDWVK